MSAASQEMPLIWCDTKVITIFHNIKFYIWQSDCLILRTFEVTATVDITEKQHS